MNGITSTTIAILTIAMNSASAQTLPNVRTLTAKEISDQFAFDEFRVQRMAEILLSVDPEKIDNLLMEHMKNKTKTVLNYDTKSVFVEYTSDDGKYYAWMPNDKKAKHGTWNIQTDAGGAKSVCFKGDEEPNATCIPSRYILSEYCTLKLSGKDDFGLMSGQIPYQKDMLSVPQ